MWHLFINIANSSKKKQNVHTLTIDKAATLILCLSVQKRPLYLIKNVYNHMKSYKSDEWKKYYPLFIHFTFIMINDIQTESVEQMCIYKFVSYTMFKRYFKLGLLYLRWFFFFFVFYLENLFRNFNTIGLYPNKRGRYSKSKILNMILHK